MQFHVGVHEVSLLEDMVDVHVRIRTLQGTNTLKEDWEYHASNLKKGEVMQSHSKHYRLGYRSILVEERQLLLLQLPLNSMRNKRKDRALDNHQPGPTQ